MKISLVTDKPIEWAAWYFQASYGIYNYMKIWIPHRESDFSDIVEEFLTINSFTTIELKPKFINVAKVRFVDKNWSLFKQYIDTYKV